MNEVRQIYEVEQFIKEYDCKRRTFFVHPLMLYVIDKLDYEFEVVDIIVSDAFPAFEYKWHPPKIKDKYFDWGDNYSILAPFGFGRIEYSTDKIWYAVKHRTPSKGFTVKEANGHEQWKNYKSPTKYNTPIVTHLCGTKILKRP